MDANPLGDLPLEVLPLDGAVLGNLPAREPLSKVAGHGITKAEQEQVGDRGLAIGTSKKAKAMVAPSPWQTASRGSSLQR